MASAKNAPTAAVDPNEIDTSKWVEERFGFAPYWDAKEGETALMTVVARDERNPEFVRYLCRAGKDLQCARGAKDDSGKPDEVVTVKRGEEFTISTFYSLAEAFDFYLASGLAPMIQITAVKKLKTSTPGRTVWQWAGKIDPDMKKALEAKKVEMQAARMNAASNGRPELEG